MKINNVLLITLVSLVSCSNIETKEKMINGQEKAKLKKLTLINIQFSPSFTNQSRLEIDRNLNTIDLIVDSMLFVDYTKLSISLPLKNFELNTQIESFYDPNFLRKIQFDSTKSTVRDGISLKVIYSDGTSKDSIFTGNNLSDELKSNLRQQLLFIKSKTKDIKLKEYLSDLSEYF